MAIKRDWPTSSLGAFGSPAHKSYLRDWHNALERVRKPFAETAARLILQLTDEVIENIDREKAAFDSAVIKLTPDGVDRLLFDLTDAGELYAANMMPHVSNGIAAGANFTIGKIGQGAFVYDGARPKIQAFEQARRLKVVTLPRTFHGQLKTIITTGLNEGVGMQEIASRIRDTQDDYSRYFGERIARTETGIAGSFGAEDSIKEMGGRRKEWISIIDGDTRTRNMGDKFEHRLANGETVGIDEFFMRTGESLKRPLDPTGSAANIIQCRCGLMPVTSDFTDLFEEEE